VTHVSSEEEIDRREEGGRHQEAEEREALDRRQEGSRDEEAHHGETEDRRAQVGGQEDDEKEDHASEDRSS
jgi:hypothetical protein